MSGIAGMINLDGSPVDRELLDRMTGFLTFRGPDAQVTWADGPVGFGHTLLRTTWESEHEEQPYSVDGEVWITADARIDDRANLIDKLAGHGREVERDVPDVELILHAYHVWGERCVEHLLGDFAFGIWDGPQQRLFCARDHFGVKPFFYARVGACLVFSNTLNCVRLHPAVSDELNDLAVADFLLFRANREPGTTTFADVQRLPPAHRLVCSAGGLTLGRYWTLPEHEEIRYRRPADYVEHFQHLMDAAVADRLRTDRASLSLSGGLDSSTLAASAVRLRARRFPALDLRAVTAVYERLIPDRERGYTGLVASALGIPLDYLVADDLKPFAWLDESEVPGPEPDDVLQPAVHIHLLRRMSAHGRVALDGNGGDETLAFVGGEYSSFLLGKLRVGRLVLDVARYAVAHRRLPHLGIRAGLKRWFGRPSPPPCPFPAWLNPDLASRLQLPDRWQRVWMGRPGPVIAQGGRAQARRRLIAPVIGLLFEELDPGRTGCLVEKRFPFFDVRLVKYLLAIPPLPWCFRKELLRAALRDQIPDAVRLRPKTPLAGFPFLAHLRQQGVASLGRPTPVPLLAHYVTPESLTPPTGEESPDEFWLKSRPRKLNAWLRSVSPSNLRPAPFSKEQSRERGQEPTKGAGAILTCAEKVLPQPGAAGLR